MKNNKHIRLKRSILWTVILLFIFSFFSIPFYFIRTGCDSIPNLETAYRKYTTDIAQPTTSLDEAIVYSLKDYKRTEESTYLTFPEWYIVYSAQEYARFLSYAAPSKFPYFSSIGQYWCSYYNVSAVTDGRYPFNAGNHFMLGVIGVSLSVEYSVKGIYDATIGRVTEILGFNQMTEEDRYAALVAKEYGDFLPKLPWYEFPFRKKLIGLWQNTHFFGPHLIRKWERKGILSLEYAVKAGYGWFIRSAIGFVYAPAPEEIMLWADTVPESILQNEPRIKVVQKVDEASEIIAIPRYAEFTDIVLLLARNQIQMHEIAGNHEILLTALAPREWTLSSSDSEMLFQMLILTEPSKKRVALRVPITSLDSLVAELEGQGVVLEHLYDY